MVPWQIFTKARLSLRARAGHCRWSMAIFLDSCQSVKKFRNCFEDFRYSKQSLNLTDSFSYYTKGTDRCPCNTKT